MARYMELIEMSLTEEELRLLSDLTDCERIISGNKNRAGLKRLVAAGYVKEASLNASDTIYSLTSTGREALNSVRKTAAVRGTSR